MENFDALAGRPRQAILDLSLIADQDHPQFGIGGNGLHGAGNDGAGGKIAAHRIERDQHGLLLLLHLHHCPALVKSAVRTNLVRQYRLTASAAILDLDRLYVQMTAPLALPGVGRSSLGYSHGPNPSMDSLQA